MTSEAVKGNSTFYGKAFRQDVQRVCGLTAERVQNLRDFLIAIVDYRHLADESKWTDISASFGEPLDEVMQYLRPIQFIATVATKERCSAQDVVFGLSAIGVIPEDKIPIIVSLCDPVHKLIARADEEIAPSLPLHKIKSISTSCLLIPEFDEEFSTEKHNPEQYRPGISRLYPAATIKLSFYDDPQGPIGIQVSDRDLDTLIKWLQLTRAQLRALASFGRKHDLPLPYIPGSEP